MGYRFIDHTADVAVDLSGATPGELFASAAEALMDTITDRTLVRPVQSDEVALEAASPEDLLVDWLNELLYRFEVRDLLVANAEVTVTMEGPCRLAATVRGEPFDPGRHPSRALVKGATYHGLRVEQQDGEWRARIVFDI